MPSHAHAVKPGFALPKLIRNLVRRFGRKSAPTPPRAARDVVGPGLVADLGLTFRDATRVFGPVRRS